MAGRSGAVTLRFTVPAALHAGDPHGRAHRRDVRAEHDQRAVHRDRGAGDYAGPVGDPEPRGRGEQLRLGSTRLHRPRRAADPRRGRPRVRPARSPAREPSRGTPPPSMTGPGRAIRLAVAAAFIAAATLGLPGPPAQAQAAHVAVVVDFGTAGASRPTVHPTTRAGTTCSTRGTPSTSVPPDRPGPCWIAGSRRTRSGHHALLVVLAQVRRGTGRTAAAAPATYTPRPDPSRAGSMATASRPPPPASYTSICAGKDPAPTHPARADAAADRTPPSTASPPRAGRTRAAGPRAAGPTPRTGRPTAGSTPPGPRSAPAAARGPRPSAPAGRVDRGHRSAGVLPPGPSGIAPVGRGAQDGPASRRGARRSRSSWWRRSVRPRAGAPGRSAGRCRDAAPASAASGGVVAVGAGLAYASMRTNDPLLLLTIAAVAALVVSARRGRAPWARAYGLLLKLGLFRWS